MIPNDKKHLIFLAILATICVGVFLLRSGCQYEKDVESIYKRNLLGSWYGTKWEIDERFPEDWYQNRGVAFASFLNDGSFKVNKALWPYTRKDEFIIGQYTFSSYPPLFDVAFKIVCVSNNGEYDEKVVYDALLATESGLRIYYESDFWRGAAREYYANSLQLDGTGDHWRSTFKLTRRPFQDTTIRLYPN